MAIVTPLRRAARVKWIEDYPAHAGRNPEKVRAAGLPQSHRDAEAQRRRTRDAGLRPALRSMTKGAIKRAGGSMGLS
jgi:hypothetical protein